MLNKENLKNSIVTLLKEMKDETGDPDEAFEKFAEEFSDIIDSYIKEATIISTPANILAAGMANTGGPVVAANNLTSIIT